MRCSAANASPKNEIPVDGLLIVDKPAGLTSAEVVRVVKRRFGCKTGHLGTLDPFATGVLPLCLGAATRIAQFLNAADKAYTGTIRLGARTDTGDPTGAIVEEATVPMLTADRLAAVAREFTGDIEQIPPMYSAVKVGGTPLYKLARRGEVIEREVRQVRVTAFVLSVGAAPDQIDFTIECSKGTYVRVIAEGVALALGGVGHLMTLRRTRFGPFGIEEAVLLTRIETGSVQCLGMREALRGLAEIRLDAEQARLVRHGYQPVLALLARGVPAQVAKLVDPADALAAVVIADEEGRWGFGRVLAPEEKQ